MSHTGRYIGLQLRSVAWMVLILGLCNQPVLAATPAQGIRPGVLMLGPPTPPAQISWLRPAAESLTPTPRPFGPAMVELEGLGNIEGVMVEANPSYYGPQIPPEGLPDAFDDDEGEDLGGLPAGPERFPSQLTPYIWPDADDAAALGIPAETRFAGPLVPASPTPMSSGAVGPVEPPRINFPCGPPVPSPEAPTTYGFVWPVGDEEQFQGSDQDGDPGFRFIRGFKPSGSRAAGKHMGLDLANGKSGSMVRAIGDGIVALVSDRTAGDPRHSGWGNLVVLSHKLPGGEVVYSLLGHLKDRSILVRPGDRVVAGQAIAEVGSTGHSTGPHLHLEMRKYLNWNMLDALPQGWQHMGFLDPLRFIARRLVSFPDLPRNHWAYNYVMPLVKMGVLVGGSSFEPERAVSGPEFTEMLRRTLGDEALLRLPGTLQGPIPEVEAVRAVQAALGLDAAGDEGSLLRSPLAQTLQVASGTPDLRRSLTRAEAAVLLKTALGISNREPASLTTDPFKRR